MEIESPSFLFHCMTCGLPWEIHEPSCCQHSKASEYINIRHILSKDPKYSKVFSLAKVNGWVLPQAECKIAICVNCKNNFIKKNEKQFNICDNCCCEDSSLESEFDQEVS
jgi:hypothetical protein